ncbi:MAG: high-potential iron-sulfur protein [Pseudomonadota bacterium]
MPKTIINGMSRRAFLGTTLGVTATAMVAGRAQAQALEPAAVQYQLEPKGDQRCDNCAFWLPGSDPAGVGACSMVKGEIQPDAWCAIWAPAA